MTLTEAPAVNGHVERFALVQVDRATGELTELEECPHCAEAKLEAERLRLELEGIESEMRSMAGKMRALQRDRDAEAKASKLYPLAVEAFEYWRIRTGKSARVKFTHERFRLLRPFLKQDGIEAVKLAIDGAAFDPHTADRPNANGTIEVYDGIETIFKNRGAFDRHCRRAPRERIREVAEERSAYTSDELRVKMECILKLGDEQGDDREWSVRVDHAFRQAKLELEGRRRAPGRAVE